MKSLSNFYDNGADNCGARSARRFTDSYCTIDLFNWKLYIESTAATF
jgi:hypothetical protein